MDITTGRFTSMDSYLGSVDDPVSLHKYLYANANPVNYIDPTGYFSLAELMEVIRTEGVLSGITYLNVNTYILYVNLENTVAGIIVKEVMQESVELALEGEVDILGIIYTGIEVVYGLAGSEKEISALRKANKTIKEISENGENLTSLYRAVGPDEFYDVMKTGEFSVIPNGLQAKQFGLSFEETLKFAEKYSDIGAVIEVKLPTDVLNKLGDFTQVDRFIFKNGTVTINADKLGEFNKAIKEIIHKY